ncbi:MAG TPA: hypothetical protein VGB77_22210 [Abditibacteriaceae bacterium]|jgi:hypothetical protein
MNQNDLPNDLPNEHGNEHANEYLVEPLPQSAPQSLPTSVGQAPEAVAEWLQDVPAPAIARAIPGAVVDGAAYREGVRRGEIPDPRHPGFEATDVQLLQEPLQQPPQTPQHASVYSGQHSIETPRVVAPAPSRANTQPASGYSPFRDDRNAYHLEVTHYGVRYFARELDDKARDYINTFARRFIADRRNRIVEIGHGLVQPRPIALEEVVGGETTYFGLKTVLPEGAIYSEFPDLKGHLVVRHIRVDELPELNMLLQLHPGLMEKYRDAEEVQWEQVIQYSLAGWSLKEELSETNIKRLSREVKRVLFSRIGAQSEFGLSDDDFLQR